MPILDIDKTFADGEVLFESDLDNIKNDIETFVNVTKLDDSNIQDAGITASTKFVDNSITGGKIASEAITTAKIIDGAITTAKIADSNVTTAKIADSNVTTVKIADSNVTTAKINDGAVTYAKRTLNYAISSSCGTYIGTGLINYITNLSVSFTATGNRLTRIYLKPDDSSSTMTRCSLSILLNGTSIGTINSFANGDSGSPTHTAFLSDSVATILSSGTHTITAVMTFTGTIVNYKLLVIEE